MKDILQKIIWFTVFAVPGLLSTMGGLGYATYGESWGEIYFGLAAGFCGLFALYQSLNLRNILPKRIVYPCYLATLSDGSADPKYWYRLALRETRRFIHKLDKNLQVRIQSVNFVSVPGRPYSETLHTYVLLFSHKTNPRISWTMTIQENWSYIRERLEQEVTAIFYEQQET